MFTNDGYSKTVEEIDDELDELFDPLHGGGIESRGAKAEIHFYNQGYREWLAPLMNGILFTFRPGHRYDIIVMREDGWIDRYDDVIFIEFTGKVGKFMALTLAEHKSPIINNNVIVTARVTKTQ